uniref:OadG family protein n=1 Tax=Ningiella ruwaisensis TaxID=2364274 RepID=UPI00109EFD5B|nr:OadG family transporter subunit [Ningiella ruwaisensis]
MQEQLIEAAMLLGVGMSVVFAFLSLLIAGIHTIAWFVRQYPEPLPVSATKTKNNKNQSSTTTVKPDIVAAISAAIHTHQKKNKQN